MRRRREGQGMRGRRAGQGRDLKKDGWAA